MDPSDGAAGGGAQRHEEAAARALGERLRWVRMQQHRSLQDVERMSGGELKASVLGAYERGERTVSIPRLRTLAGFYGVPVTELLPLAERRGPSAVPTDGAAELVIDLAALERSRDEEPVLARYVQAIQTRRGDWGGRVLTVRAHDLETLAAVSDATPEQLRDRLAAAGIVR